MMIDHPFGEVVRRQVDFVESYILERFGSRPEDEELAQSEALKAFYLSEGFSFFTRSGDETFILPDARDPEGVEL